MKFILLGGDELGIQAYRFLGEDRVFYFADDFLYEIGVKELFHRRVLNLNEMINKLLMEDRYIGVVAVQQDVVRKKWIERLDAAGVQRYFVFNATDIKGLRTVEPKYQLHRHTQYVNYTQRLSDMQIDKYKSVAILGDNHYLPYLISEFGIQSNLAYLRGIIKTSTEKVNTLGIPVVQLDDLWSDIDCLIINDYRHKSPFIDRIENENHKFDIVYLYDDAERSVLSFHYLNLKKYRDLHHEKRCFLIGNGPSLAIQDLETLHQYGEICFGFNNIYRIYPQTNWRANYLGVMDIRYYAEYAKVSRDLPGVLFVAEEWNRFTDMRIEHAEYFHHFHENFSPYHPRFSEDICKGVYWGHTVMYDIGLQFAAYMGFQEIYLLGVDNSKGYADDPQAHPPNYLTKEQKEMFRNVVFPGKSRDMAYEKAEQYSRQHGFRIYNATRGGELEVFERVNFDQLFD